MLMRLDKLVKKYEIEPKGLLHLGAHEGEEAFEYDLLGFKPVVWVEADPDTFKRMNKHVSHYDENFAICALISDVGGVKTKFNIANNGQSSSMLELGTHKREHPEVHYEGSVQMVTRTVDDLGVDFRGFNFLNMDLQGAEGLAVKGAKRFLAHTDYIMSEINKRELYKGCVLVDELDALLPDFERVETMWTRHGWGDAFYVRKSLL